MGERKNDVKRFSASLMLGMLALLVFAIPASAARTWCAKDPIVSLNGKELQIWAAIPEEYVPLVNGPLDFKILTPQKVTRELIFMDEGFNGYGESVTFHDLTGSNGKVNKDGSFTVQVRVKVPIDNSKLPGGARAIPLRLEIIVNGESYMIEMTNDGAWLDVVIK